MRPCGIHWADHLSVKSLDRRPEQSLPPLLLQAVEHLCAVRAHFLMVGTTLQCKTHTKNSLNNKDMGICIYPPTYVQSSKI